MIRVGPFQLRLFHESLTLKKAGYVCRLSMAKEPLVWEAGSASAPHQLALPPQPGQHGPAECSHGAVHHSPLALQSSTTSWGAVGAWAGAAGMTAQASPDVLGWGKSVWDMGCPRSRAGHCGCALVLLEEPQGQQCGAVLCWGLGLVWGAAGCLWKGNLLQMAETGTLRLTSPYPFDALGSAQHGLLFWAGLGWG